MPITYSKFFGGRRFGWGVTANKSGVKTHTRFSFCGYVTRPLRARHTDPPPQPQLLQIGRALHA